SEEGGMPVHITAPMRITAAGNKPKLIDQNVGRVNRKTSGVSVAHMRSPQGWVEPGQTPEFDEYTIGLRGALRVTHREGGSRCGPARRRRAARRMGAVQHARNRWGGIRRRLSARVLARHRPPRHLSASRRGHG